MTPRAVRKADDRHIQEESHSFKNVTKLLEEHMKKRNPINKTTDVNYETNIKGTIVLPYIQGVMDRISRIIKNLT